MDAGAQAVIVGAPWWATILSAFLGAWAGYTLGRWKDQETKEERRRTSWAAVKAEFEICAEMADAYMRPVVIKAPSYRWPVIAYEHVLAELFLLDKLTVPEVKALLMFFGNVDALNRGLDIAQERRDNERLLEEQFKVNLLKIAHIRKGGDFYEAASSVIERHTLEHPHWA